MRCPRRSEIPTTDDGEDRYDDGKCSYCGSLSAGAFFDRVEAGELVGPTDKSYKAYIGGNGKFYFQHLESNYAKHRFIRMFNDRTMKLGPPGNFYVTPYFMKAMNGVEIMAQSIEEADNGH